MRRDKKKDTDLDFDEERIYSSHGINDLPIDLPSVSRDIKTSSKQQLPAVNKKVSQMSQTSKLMHHSIEIDENTFTKAQNTNMNILSQIDNYEMPVRVAS